MQDTLMFGKGMGRDDKTTPVSIPSCNIIHNRLTTRRGGYPIPLTSYHKKNIIIHSALLHHHPAPPPASAHDEYSSVTKDMSDAAVQGEHPSSSSSWMTEEEKDMVMKSQLNQMAQVNTGVQDRNGKFVFERGNNNTMSMRRPRKVPSAPAT
ncbi:hypothetical protein FOZ62_012875, partial [Perkinsus olseni]